MLVVRRVPAPVVHVVDMVAVGDRDMAASVAVDVVMRFMHRVSGWLTFVVVIPMLPMQVTVVHIVDVIPMWDRDMAASFAVGMVMFEMLVVDCARHRFSPPVCELRY